MNLYVWLEFLCCKKLHALYVGKILYEVVYQIVS